MENCNTQKKRWQESKKMAKSLSSIKNTTALYINVQQSRKNSETDE